MIQHPYGSIITAIGATFFGVITGRRAPAHHLELGAAGLARCCELLGESLLARKLEAFWSASGVFAALPSLLEKPLAARFPPSEAASLVWLDENFPEVRGEELTDGGDFFDKDTLATLLEIFQEEAREVVLEQVRIHVRGDFSVQDVAELFRYAHTLKGAAATVGLSALSREALTLESYYRAHRDAQTTPSRHSLPLMDLATLRFIRAAQGDPDPGPWNNGSLLAFARACDKVPDPFELFNGAPPVAPALAAPASQPEASSSVLSAPAETSRSFVEEDSPLDEEMTALLMEVFQTEAEEHLDALDRNL
jgi:HPt (histidine-containing phosphotransfer) domain-containing protein